jgi:hypothetical protein
MATAWAEVRWGLHTRNGNLATADQAQSNSGAIHLGTTTGDTGPRRQPARLGGRTDNDTGESSLGAIQTFHGRSRGRKYEAWNRREPGRCRGILGRHNKRNEQWPRLVHQDKANCSSATACHLDASVLPPGWRAHLECLQLPSVTFRLPSDCCQMHLWPLWQDALG